MKFEHKPIYWVYSGVIQSHFNNTVTMQIIQADQRHFKSIQQLARETYQQNFSEIWTQQGMQDYLNLDFSDQHLQASLDCAETSWLILTDQQNNLGYAKINWNQFNTELNQTGAELQKIYLLKESIGKSYASHLMQAVLDLAIEKKQSSIFLEVLSTNHRAQTFYRKFGFQPKMSIPFATDLLEIGMFIMHKDLEIK